MCFFDAALAIAPNAAKTVSLEMLMLEAVRISDDDFDSLDESANSERRGLDSKLSSTQSARTGARTAQVERTANPAQLSNFVDFIECYGAALSILRASAFADGETKNACVSAAIDCSMSLVASFDTFLSVLEGMSGLWPELDKLSKSDRIQATSLLSALMLIVTNSLLGLAGGSRHLEKTLTNYIENEVDEARSMTALMWLISIAPGRAVELTERYLKRDLSGPCLNIVSFWIMAQYYANSVMERKKDARWREAFRHVARSIAEQSQPGNNRSAINNATDKIVRTFERRIDASEAARK